MSKIIVDIESFDDFKANFGDKYCDSNKILKNEFKGLTFHFMINLEKIIDEKIKTKILEGYQQIKKRYYEADFCLFFKINIKNEDSYVWFFDTFVEFENTNKKPIIKREYREALFYFEINYKNDNKANELLIHNFLLIKNVLNNDNFILNVNATAKNEGRINAYTIGHNPNKKTVYFNNKEITLDVKSINKLFPALFIDNKTLTFLQNPISDDAWKQIKGSKINKETSFKDSMDSKYWFILRACQNYLFDEYKNNNSSVYTTLRKLAYTSHSFESHIKRIPLLSLIIFSQYDHYYRNALLKSYKSNLNTNILTYSDFINVLQGVQNYKNYTQYAKASTTMDIKTLLIYEDEDNILNKIRNSNIFLALIENIQKCEMNFKEEKNSFSQECNCSLNVISKKRTSELINDLYGFVISKDLSTINCKSFFKSLLPCFAINNLKKLSDDERNKIKQKISLKNDELQKKYIDKILEVKFDIDFIKNYKIHPDILSELFEAITITEGLLQLIENAVIHANGGLLSMHIFDTINNNDFDYVKHQYKNFNMNNNRFFLEFELSDIYNKNIKENFIENTMNTLKNNISIFDYLNRFDDQKDVFELFFKPECIENGTNFWEKYYEIPKNQVHHYGLQIFESVVQAKQGLFIASGHGEIYPFDSGIECDINMPGTSYRILLPLNHVKTDNKDIINGTTYEKLLSYDILKEYFDSKDEIRQCYVEDNKLYSLLLPDYKNPEEKEKKVKSVYEIIRKQHIANEKNGKYQLMINCDFSTNSNNYKIELLIKGLLCFLFESESKPPVTLYNMSSHDILEATRIIALFFNKNGFATKNMKNIQLYLKGNAIGEEILFAGENLNWNAERLRKIAMTRGIMYDYGAIAQMLMSRKNKTSNK